MRKVVSSFFVVALADPSWWIALKTPKDTKKHPNLQNPTGLTYDYADSNTLSFQTSNHALDADSSPLQVVMRRYREVQSRSGVGYIEWNDGKPDARQKRKTCQKAHAKGLLFFDKDGGTLLTHSAPHFPNRGNVELFYPENAELHAQHFLCVNLTRDGVEAFAAGVLTYLYPDVTAQRMDSTLTGYPTLTRIIKQTPGWKKHEGVQRVDLTLPDRTTLLIVTKPCGTREPIYEHASRVVGSRLLVQTWLVGAGAQEEESTPNVRKVCNLNDTKGVQWGTNRDHSKIFVATAYNNFYVGVGDLNRRTSQHKRGGSVYLLRNKVLYHSFRSRIALFNETCKERQHICKYPKERDPTKDDVLCRSGGCVCTDEDCCKHDLDEAADAIGCLRVGDGCPKRRQNDGRQEYGKCAKLPNGAFACVSNVLNLDPGFSLSLAPCLAVLARCALYNPKRPYRRRLVTAGVCKETAVGLRCVPEGAEGTWSDWAYTSCDKPCGVGFQARTRTCTWRGQCRGAASEFVACNAGNCEHCARSSLDGTCGPQHEGRTCDTQAQAFARYCNISSGWCTSVEGSAPAPSQFTAAAGCGGCPPSHDHKYLCLDGERCIENHCCNSHGGIERCPTDRPFMCTWKVCGIDHCCVEFSEECDDRGGVLRACPRCADTTAGLQVGAKLNGTNNTCRCQDNDASLQTEPAWGCYTCAYAKKYGCHTHRNILMKHCPRSCHACDVANAKKNGKCPVLGTNCAKMSGRAPCAVAVSIGATAWLGEWNDQVDTVWVADQCVLQVYEHAQFQNMTYAFPPGTHEVKDAGVSSVKCYCEVCTTAQLPSGVVVSSASPPIMSMRGFHVHLECARGTVRIGLPPRATVCDAPGTPYKTEHVDGCVYASAYGTWADYLGQYADHECENIGGASMSTLGKCQTKCENTVQCTAVNYSEKDRWCVFRMCAENVIRPAARKALHGFSGSRLLRRSWSDFPVDYSDHDCQNIGDGSLPTQTLRGCKTQCEQKSRCNAINYSKLAQQCVFRSCTADVMGPHDKQSVDGYVGSRLYRSSWSDFIGAYSNEDCQNVGDDVSKTLHACKKACESIFNCNAVNYSPYPVCVFRMCMANVIRPTANLPLDGYSGSRFYPGSWLKYFGVYSDEDCENIGDNMSKTVHVCKKACESRANCNAINYSSYPVCVFRKCERHVIGPSATEPRGFSGYRFFPSSWSDFPATYADADCENIGFSWFSTRRKCKAACELRSDCNAVNYSKVTTICVFRKCANHVNGPMSTVPWGGFSGSRLLPGAKNAR